MLLQQTLSAVLSGGLWLIAADPSFSLAASVEPARVVIETARLGVRFEPATGQFVLREATAGRDFAVLSLAGDKAAAKVVEANHPQFGRGKTIEIRRADGSSGRVTIFPELPFVLVQASIVNTNGEAQTFHRVSLAAMQLNPGAPAAQLTCLGTGGLTSPTNNPGSYAWLAVAEPKNRAGVVGGWLTHEKACGVVFAGTEGDRVTLAARGEYGQLRLPPGGTMETETFAIGYFADARLGLEAWAEAVARMLKIKLPPQPSGYCTWYADRHGGAGDEKSTAELAEFVARELKPFGFDFIQIDDKWQAGASKNGPNKNFTTHNPGGPYPSGMKATAENIRRQGLTPGLWFMPFAGNFDDPWFQGHPEWFVKRRNGKPYDSNWSATCLDMSDAGASNYVRSVVERMAGEWGFTYFKMDGIHTGVGTPNIYVNAAYAEDHWDDAVFADPKRAPMQIYRDGLRMIRRTAGPQVFFLGCCAPQNMRSYAGVFGLVDAMRVGPDNGGNWKGWASVSPVYGTRHYFLNRRIWYCDPDPIYLRASISDEQARAICSWTALSGQLLAASDWLPALPSERLDMLKRCLPAHQAVARPIDLFETDTPRLWLVTDRHTGTRRDVVALFNWSNKPASIGDSLERIGLNGHQKYAAFDFWANELVPTIEGDLRQELPPESCRILAVRPVSTHPQVISTSRHVTQGMVDVLAESWDPSAAALSGRSRLIANDPYEVRILTAGRAFVSAELSARDKAAGEKVLEARENGGLLRVRLLSPVTREVDWRVNFR